MPITRVGNAIFVQAKIAEQTPVNLLVDSAASATLILDRTLANHMRLPARGAENLKGAGKDECPADRLAATRIIVGEKTLSVSNPFATDLSHIIRFLKRRTGGAIGGNLFRGHVVTLDFARNLLTLSSARLDSQDQESMPMFSLGDLCCAIETDLEVNGRTIRGIFVLDTGAPTIEAALTRSFAQKAKLLPNKKLHPVIRLPGLCGKSVLGKFPGPTSLGIRGQRIPVDLWIGLDTEGALNAASFDGILGGQFLARFREVTFDSVGKKLILKQ